MTALLDTSQLQSTPSGLGTTTSQGVNSGTAPSVTTTPQQPVAHRG